MVESQTPDLDGPDSINPEVEIDDTYASLLEIFKAGFVSVGDQILICNYPECPGFIKVEVRKKLKEGRLQIHLFKTEISGVYNRNQTTAPYSFIVKDPKTAFNKQGDYVYRGQKTVFRNSKNRSLFTRILTCHWLEAEKNSRITAVTDILVEISAR